MDFELYIPPPRPQINRSNGQFLKGHVPHNKGVKGWQKSLPKKTQKKIAKGWQNVMNHRPKNRPDVIERCSRKVVVITDEKQFKIFINSVLAGEWAKGHCRNIRRCCANNQERHINKKTGKVNTDHKYLGVRWYYYDDPIWWDKV